MFFRKYPPEYTVIAVFIAIGLVLQLTALSNSGFFSDEFLHIEAGRHPAWGYSDFPPMIAAFAWIQNLFNTDSVFINHLFNLAASAMAVLFCGLTTIKLGGKWLAVLATLLCILLSPGIAGTRFLFLPTAFDQLFWIICIYCSASYCQSQNARYLIWFCIFGALGFLTKYSIVFLFAGMLTSSLIFRRDIFLKKSLWIGLLIFLVLITPNLCWQIKNQFPAITHFSQLYDSQLNRLSMGGELKKLFLFSNPFTMIFWLPGLFAIPFISKFKRYKLISFALCCSFVFLFCAKGKWYYFFPVVIGAIPLGTVFFERLLQKRKWIIYAYLTVLGLTGVYLLPQGIPIIKLQRFIELYHKKPNKDGKIPLAFDNYYSTEIWTRILNVVNKTYIELSSEEQEKCFILGRHYSMAGAMNLLGKKYGLPQAFSLHSSFEWMPEFDKGAVIIAIGESNWLEQHWGEYFKYVEEIGIVENKYASKESEYNYRIFLCKGLKYNSVEFKRFIEN
ncbi:glycosyltransferase family 39 protein [Alistipes sp.]|uniref:ArnT family glycosyltransferase n=1 Tax=Alistipes sp. TaxID=1872444 RepID=UPI002877DA50|nr:glycosyltransferase family 39 protein [Alistipes sp.]